MFWDNFWPNFVSDLVSGLLLSLLVAFVISKYLSAQEKQTSKADVLKLIKKELLMNYETVDERISILKSNAQTLPGFKNEYWQTILSSTGTTIFGSDSKLAERISKAYYLVNEIRFAEHECFKLRVQLAATRMDDSDRLSIINDMSENLANGYRTYKDYMAQMLNWNVFAELPYENDEVVWITHPVPSKTSQD